MREMEIWENYHNSVAARVISVIENATQIGFIKGLLWILYDKSFHL